MRRFLLFGCILALVAVFVWAASKFPAVSLSLPAGERLSPTATETLGLTQACEACAQATQAITLTQETINCDASQAQTAKVGLAALIAANRSMNLAQLKVEPAVVIPVAPTARATRQSAPPQTAPPGSYPLISGITDHARQIFLHGQRLGNRANVFSKIGDSITANDVFLAPIGRGRYDLHLYTYLAPVIAYFSQVNARTANSFANTSLAAKGGWPASQVINPRAVFEPAICNSTETPLECEYRVVKPSVALIMIGTNDVRYTSAPQYEAELRQTIQTSINRGIIPVISTIPPLHCDWAVGRVEVINGIIVSLAREYDIPLWDYWSALQGLPNDGLSTDGVHPSVYTSHAADFSQDYIEAGYTVRNLLALQALDAVWQAALH